MSKGKPFPYPEYPRPKPSGRPVSIETARRERELDRMIQKVQPTMAAFDRFAAANDINPRELLTSKAMAIWSGRSVSFTATPRAWIF